MPSQAVIVGPKGMDAAVVAKVEGAIEKAVADKAFLDLLANKLRFPAKFVGHKELTAQIQEVIAGMKRVIAATKK